MASFDIQSLFTNISLNETYDIFVDMVYNKPKKVKGMLNCHYGQLMTLLVEFFVWLFNGVY